MTSVAIMDDDGRMDISTECISMWSYQCKILYIYKKFIVILQNIYFLMIRHLRIVKHVQCSYIITLTTDVRLIESMMGLRLRQGNLRLVFRLFSLMRGLPISL